MCSRRSELSGKPLFQISIANQTKLSAISSNHASRLPLRSSQLDSKWATTCSRLTQSNTFTRAMRENVTSLSINVDFQVKIRTFSWLVMHSLDISIQYMTSIEIRWAWELTYIPRVTYPCTNQDKDQETWYKLKPTRRTLRWSEWWTHLTLLLFKR